MTADYSGEYDPDQDFDRWYTALTARRLGRFLGDDDTILELGSATGALTKTLVGHGRRIVCVERSAGYVARAQSRAMPGVEIVRCDIEAFSSDLAFDHIVAINVLHEVPDQGAVIVRLRSFMRDGTLLHVTLPNPRSLHRLSALGSGMIQDLREPSERGRKFDTVQLQHGADFVQQMARLGLREVCRQPILVKPLPNQQMELLSDELIEAYDTLASSMPDFGAMNYFVFRRSDD